MIKTQDMKEIDRLVGQRLRELCVLKGVTQEQLGRMTGVTFQQIQKRMSGANRMGASVLYATARALNVPVSYFFEDLPADPSAAKPTVNGAGGKDPLARRETLELVRAYYRIGDPNVRRRTFDLVKAMGNTETE